MGSIKENSSITITRRQLLLGAGAAGIAAGIWFLGNKTTEASPNSPGQPDVKKDDPYGNVALFAQAALRGDTQAMAKYVSPEKVSSYSNDPNLRQLLSLNLGPYKGCDANLAKTSPVVRLLDAKNNTYTISYQLDKVCKAVVFQGSPSVDFSNITVAAEKVSLDGKDKYYPQYIR